MHSCLAYTCMFVLTVNMCGMREQSKVRVQLAWSVQCKELLADGNKRLLSQVMINAQLFASPEHLS